MVDLAKVRAEIERRERLQKVQSLIAQRGGAVPDIAKSQNPIDPGTISERQTWLERVGGEMQEDRERSPWWQKYIAPIAATKMTAKLLSEGGRAVTDLVRENVLTPDRVGDRPLQVPTEDEFKQQSPGERIAKAVGRAVVGHPLGIIDFLTQTPHMFLNPQPGQGGGELIEELGKGAAELPLGVLPMLSEVGRNLREGEGVSGVLGEALRPVDYIAPGAEKIADYLGIEDFAERQKENVRIAPESMLYGGHIGKAIIKKASGLAARPIEAGLDRRARTKTRERVAENIAESRTARESSRFTDPAERADLGRLNEALEKQRTYETGVRSMIEPQSGPLRLPAPEGYGEGFTFRDVRPEHMVVLTEGAKRQVRTTEGNPRISENQRLEGRPVKLAGPNTVIRPRMEFERALAEFAARQIGKTEAAQAIKAKAAKSGVDVKKAAKYGAAGAAAITTVAAAQDEEMRDYALAGLAFMGFARGGKRVNPRAAEIMASLQKGEVAKQLRVRYPINTNTLNIGPAEAAKIGKAERLLAVELERIKGKPITHQEIIEAAKTQEMLRGVITREQQLTYFASVEKAAQQLAAASKLEGLTPELVEALVAVSSAKTFHGRGLEMLKIVSDPVLSSTRNVVLDKILQKNQNVEAIIAAAKDVDWTNSKQVTELYRKFVKPDIKEWLDEYRYINLLSSPRTHVINAFSNFLQGAVLRPSTMAAGVGVDWVASAMKKGERQVYARQIPAYYKGYFSSLPDASRLALRALKGKDILERPDVPRLPTNNPLLRPFYFIPRALEAGDVFFRTMITEGEYASLAAKAKKQGKPFNAAEARVQAENIAEELVFRKRPDPSNLTGQGTLLSSIDWGSELMYKWRGKSGAVRWFVPFVQTPMNIFKQGIEYSPLGFLTIRKNANPRLQLSKALVGSTVMAGAAGLAMSGLTTWSVPGGEKQRQLFYEAGMQPYSIKIGDKWVAYSKLGPLAYPIAMAAAFKYNFSDQNKAMTDANTEKIMKSLGGIAGFFSDQSYVQGIGDLIDAVRGEDYAMTRAFTNIPRQLIPLTAFQSWVNQLIDPTFRKSENIIDDFQKNVIGLSRYAPAYTTSTGAESKRELRGINALSPFAVREEKPAGKWAFKTDLAERQRDAVRTQARNMIRDKRYAEAMKIIAKWNQSNKANPIEPFAQLRISVEEYELRKRVRELREGAGG